MGSASSELGMLRPGPEFLKASVLVVDPVWQQNMDIYIYIFYRTVYIYIYVNENINISIPLYQFLILSGVQSFAYI